MQTLGEIKAMLEERGLSPRHKLGQNFLIDQNLITKLVDASGVGAGDLVLEVGPGTGTMTEALLSRGSHVIACELDPELAQLNRDRLGDRAGFTLIKGDCLESKRELSREVARALGDQTFVLVSNLPYGAATPLMLTLLIAWPACRGQFVTIQKEVAERLAAKPGTKAYGVISVVAQLFSEVEILAKLPPGCFWPQPEVTSAMVSIVPRGDAPEVDRGAFAGFCQSLFGQRRKQLGRVLGRAGWPIAGIEAAARAESLEPEQFLSLYRARGAVG